MPTTIPSPADRDDFHFVAVGKDGLRWRWDDEEMVWVRVTNDTEDACPETH